jgi:MerR family redox-sensitive transcriptional activator SoxR
MKIGQLAARAGLNASAIRYYEKMGLLAPPQRLSGQRRYPSETLDRVLLIRFATDMGFTLAEIKLFLSGLRDNTPVGPRWKKLAARKIIEVDQTITRSLKLKALLQGLLRCHCPSLQFCVTRLRLSPNFRLLTQLRE